MTNQLGGDGKSIMTVIVSFFLIVGIIALIPGVVLYCINTQTDRTVSGTIAKINSTSINNATGIISTGLSLSFTYKGKAHTTSIISLTSAGSTYTSYNDGANVNLTVNPNNLDDVAILYTLNDYYFVGIFLIVVAVLCLVIGLALLYVRIFKMD